MYYLLTIFIAVVINLHYTGTNINEFSLRIFTKNEDHIIVVLF